jgi:hypothetical protein
MLARPLSRTRRRKWTESLVGIVMIQGTVPETRRPGNVETLVEGVCQDR